MIMEAFLYFCPDSIAVVAGAGLDVPFLQWDSPDGRLRFWTFPRCSRPPFFAV